jgi:hypothetical protein
MLMNKVASRPAMRRWLARIAAAPIGLRLCGMVEEPPLPSAMGSNASPTSVCMSRSTSVAIVAEVPDTAPRTAAMSAMRPRSACQEIAGSPSFKRAASALRT